MNSVCRRPSVGSKHWWKSSVKSVWSVREKNVLRERKTSYASHKQANRGNLTYYSPLQSERGWGWGLCELCMPEAFCELETVRLKPPWPPCSLWEKKNIQHERKECLLWEKIRPTPHVNSIIGVNSYFTYYLQQLCKIEKNPYNPPSWPPSQHSYSIVYNRGYNSQ